VVAAGSRRSFGRDAPGMSAGEGRRLERHPAAETIDRSSIASESSLQRGAADRAEWLYRLAVVGALLFGWALRLLLWWQSSRGGVVPPVSDEEEYWRGAVQLLHAGYYDTGQWLRAPLPSLALALCLVLGGPDLPRALGLQALLSGLAVLPIAATARSYWRSRRAGIAAAIVAALYVPFALAAGQLMSEAIALPAIALTLWCFERWRAGDRLGWLWAAGLCIAAFTLARAVGMYAHLLALVWIAWRVRARTGSLARVAAALGVFLLGFWLVITPWSIRSTLALGQLVLVDTNAGFSFWSGTDDPADKLALQVQLNETIANPAEREDVYLARALDNIRRDPLDWIAAGRSKIVAFWQPRVRALIANSLYGLVPAANSVAYTLAGDALFVAVVLGALLSVCAIRQADPNWVLLGWPIYGTAIAAASLGHPRLRIPFEVALVALAAYTLAHPRLAWQQLRARSRLVQGAFAGAVLGFGLLIGSASYVPFVRSQAQLLLAELRWRWGDRDGSLRASEAAVEAAPGSALPLLALAERQDALGIDERIRSWQRVVALDERVLPAQAALLREALQEENAAAIAAQLAAIRAIRFDDNRLYEWLWRQNVRLPRARLDVGTDADYGLVRGVDEARMQDGIAYRWTHGRAEVRMPGGPATTLHLRLRDWRAESTVRIFADGRPLGSCSTGFGWSTCSLALPASDSPRTIRIDAPAGVLWPPDDYLLRGVALAAVWIDSRR